MIASVLRVVSCPAKNRLMSNAWSSARDSRSPCSSACTNALEQVVARLGPAPVDELAGERVESRIACSIWRSRSGGR